ncbi:hypothetical protein [Microbacterium sp. bgisy203]|uniref:hypothetical protein n=1 Tax=Microbacterium sp. bgisy203 TaxID=3413799 RepID=UPI003D72B8BC
MVATVLRLRYRILGNTLARSPWQLVGFCFGIVWALSILGLVVSAMVGAGALADLTTVRTVAILGGSALLVGWLVGPLLVAGTDATVDAVKLATFPLTRRQVMQILTMVGLTGIPGIATSVAALASVALWVRWPVAAVAAVPCAALAVVTCVLASRLGTALSAGLGGNRRGREIVGTVVLLLVVFAGPLLSGILAVVSGAGDLGGQLHLAGSVLGWTPIGAAWAVPGDLAAGAWLTGAAKFVIALATPALLWLAWGRVLDRAASSPPRRTARTVRAGSLGLFGVMPTGGVGATWARSLTGWLRDPRYLRQLIIAPVFPLIFAFTGGVDGFMFMASALFAAFVLCFVGYTDISYDGTAFASVLASPIRGWEDRWGRVLGAAGVGIPLVVAIAVVTLAIAGRLGLLPAVLGASLGLLLVGYGVTAVSSALIVTPVAAPGDSPFKTVPGQTFVSGLLVFVVIGVSAVLAAPALVVAAISLTTGDAALAWVALAVGILTGVAVVVAGVLLGGRTLERTGPDLLVRIKAFPMG